MCLVWGSAARFACLNQLAGVVPSLPQIVTVPYIIVILKRYSGTQWLIVLHVYLYGSVQGVRSGLYKNIATRLHLSPLLSVSIKGCRSVLVWAELNTCRHSEEDEAWPRLFWGGVAVFICNVAAVKESNFELCFHEQQPTRSTRSAWRRAWATGLKNCSICQAANGGWVPVVLYNKKTKTHTFKMTEINIHF